MASSSVEKAEGQLQILLITKQKQYAVPDVPYSIGANVASQELNVLINSILAETNPDHEAIEFDFLVASEFLRLTLKQHLREREISFEDHILIEYVEKYPSPEPQECLLHDDWVSAVQASGDWILTGCYDNSLNIWTIEGKHRLTIPGHDAPIKDVTWISLDDTIGVFASASQDQTAMIWEWNIRHNSVECVQICKGHERGIDCIDVSSNKEKLATGSWDTLLKIWSVSDEQEVDHSTQAKKAKSRGTTKTPQLTLEGHREAISSVQWIDNHTLLTASWDHTMKLWDLQLGGVKHELTGNKSFFDADYSQLNHLIITCSPDKNLKLYDPKSTQGSIIKSSYSGHSQWIQCVKWSKTEEFLFISGAYDNQVKLWDYRSPKAPLYDLIGHEDKVLCCDWSNPNYMMSGGSDNSLRIFKSNKSPQKMDEN
uniref:Ribosome biogenesis protein WDR12 homolog n=1 Tax=Culicoides sonorensis TaxID=179676 RepID=A0A336M4V3_CULSO